MTTRPLEERDLEALKAIYEALPYRFDDGFPDFLGDEYEGAQVVLDAADRPVAAVGAKKAIELVMVCDPARPVLMRMEAIGLLHRGFRGFLRRIGFKEAMAFMPSEIEPTHGRTMRKRFGWQKAWPGYRVT